MNNDSNDWYIDRASNIYIEGFEEILNFFVQNCKEEIEGKKIVEKLTDFPNIKISKGNPYATLTHYRDIGIINKDNKISTAAIEYVDNKLDLSSFLIDILFKRFNRKKPKNMIKPFVLICKFFDILFQMEIDKDEIFLDSRECVKYLYPIDDYDELNHDFVENIILKRKYLKNKENKVYEFKDNESTNINIWFNALKETPLFLPIKKNKEKLIPNIEQRAFFVFIANNGVTVIKRELKENKDIYNYYCDSNTGITEILPRVILKEISNINLDNEIEAIFDYLFGYKMFKNFDYTKYFKYPCFGVYFPFIVIPHIAIRQIYYDNPVIGDKLYNYLTNYKKIIQKKEIEMMNNILNKEKKFTNPHQKIFFGAPGTGKSYKVSKLIEETFGKDENLIKNNVIRTTIYQDYSYYDFIGNIMPENDGTQIKYVFKPGPFTEALIRAFENENEDVFLVIEEMSRGNIASIFGDIFQLLDRENGVSQYPIDNSLISQYIKKELTIDDEKIKNGKIYLPSNLHILGTVNTSDQNVNVMDTAFKRRFLFEYVDTKPVYDEEKNPLNDFKFELSNEEFNWIKLYQNLNKFIVEDLELSEDKQLGQFFLKFTENEEENYEQLNNKLLQYLWEDVVLASISDNVKLFDEDIKTFSNLYEKFKNREQIFSEVFIKKYGNYFGVGDELENEKVIG